MKTETTESNWLKYVFNKKLTGIIPFIFTISIFFFDFWLEPVSKYLVPPEKFGSHTHSISMALAYLIFPLILLILSLWLVSYIDEILFGFHSKKEEQKKIHSLDRAIEFALNQVRSDVYEVSKGHRIREIGDSIQCISTIQHEMKGADLIQNTFVRFEDSERYEDAVVPVYRAFFEDNREGVWEDLISYPEVFSKRFEMPLDADVVRDRHHVRILRHNVPLINFMILYQGEEPTNAYIGWVHEKNSKSPIFATRDKIIVKMLQSHFKKLWDNKTFHGRTGDPVNRTIHVDYSKPVGKRFEGIDLVRKFGYWVTLSFGIDEMENITEYSYTVICIELEHGTVAIKGHVHRIVQTADPTLKEESLTYTSGDLSVFRIVQTANSLYFDYSLKDISTIPDGFCTYKFVERDGIDAIEGFHVNDRSRVRREVVGQRLDHTSYGNSPLYSFDPRNFDTTKLRSMAQRRVKALL